MQNMKDWALGSRQQETLNDKHSKMVSLVGLNFRNRRTRGDAKGTELPRKNFRFS